MGRSNSFELSCNVYYVHNGLNLADFVIRQRIIYTNTTEPELLLGIGIPPKLPQ